jgi:hypothetical protein
MSGDIATTVAALPAPKMFEFMTQIKACVEVSKFRVGHRCVT